MNTPLPIMKITFFLSILIYIFCHTLTFAQTGDLVVFTTDGVKIHLALDGKFQHKTAVSNIKVIDVPEGNYWVTLYFGAERNPLKSNIKVLSDKENSFVVNYDGNAWKLKTYSLIPRSQVNRTISNVAYTREGVVVDGMNSDKTIKKDQIDQAKDDIEVGTERNRQGKFRGTFSDGAVTTARQASPPKEGTTITKRYIETKNPDGTITITEAETTTIRTIVNRNGQDQMRTKRSTALTPTNFTCLPMPTADFDVLFEKANAMDDAARLQLFQKDLDQQCFTPQQIKKLGDLFEDEEIRHHYAQTALPLNADPEFFPYELHDVAIHDPVEINEPFPDEESTEAQEARAAAEAVTTTETVEEKPTNVIIDAQPIQKEVLTKAQIRAMRRLEKIKACKAKKAAKAKARAERKAAKEKAKTEHTKK